jgi:hypothetical protein
MLHRKNVEQITFVFCCFTENENFVAKKMRMWKFYCMKIFYSLNGVPLTAVPGESSFSARTINLIIKVVYTYT